MLNLLRRIIGEMTPITLRDIDNVALLNRMDTKFVMTEQQLARALDAVTHQYNVLEINSVRLGRYRTIYFDTSDFSFYRSHHNGERDRYKVRCRSYEDSHLCFLEVKRKTNKERTIKKRIPIPGLVESLDGFSGEQIGACLPFALDALQPVLWNRFHRMTLINFNEGERVTVDVNLEFGWNDRSFRLDHVAIVEIKQVRMNMHSPFRWQMHSQHIQPDGFSKYCIAAANLYPELKRNRFKELFLRIGRIQQAGAADLAPQMMAAQMMATQMTADPGLDATGEADS